MNESGLILILGLAGVVVMADNWVVSPDMKSERKAVNPNKNRFIISLRDTLFYNLTSKIIKGSPHE